MENQQKDIQRFLENLPDTFSILEEGVDLETQREYIEYSKSFGQGTLSKKDTLHLSSFLFAPDLNLKAKKKALCLLAHLGSIDAYRQIEKYCKQPDLKLKSWANLALQECRMFLEGNLTNSSTGFISTGLGGSGNRLRYYVLVIPSENKTFTEIQKKIIHDEFEYVCKKENSKLETIDLNDKYVGMTTLIPLDIAPSIVFETAMTNCNETGVFLFENYFSTNVFIPDIDDINEIINKLKNNF